MTELPTDHTRRSTAPIVLWLWDVLRWRSDEDRWHVFCAVRSSLSDAPNARVEAHLRVLLRFRDAEPATTLSRRSYSRWRDQQPERDELPSATAVANTFGGWPQAAEAIGQTAAPDVLSRRYTAKGPAFTPDVLVDGLKAWIATSPERLDFPPYKRWAVAEAHNPYRAVRLIAISRGPFLRVFGSWRAALEAAGAEAPPAPARGIGDAYTREEICEALQAAADTVTDRRLTAPGYIVWRESERQRGVTRPGVATTLNHFGTWHEALGAAGLISADHVAAGIRKGGRRHPDWLVHDSLKRAITALGEGLTKSQYEKWRRKQLEQNTKPAPVSGQSISERYRSWDEAVQRTLATWSESAPPVTIRRHVGDAAARAERWHKVDRGASIESLLHAFDDLGEWPSRSAYTQWRAARIADGVRTPPVSATSMLRMFGTWKAALAEVRVERRARRRRAA